LSRINLKLERKKKMSLMTLLYLGALILVLGAIGGFFWFINWLDKRIDKKDRLGSSSVYRSGKDNEKEE
jgi:flagellar basal body-associated protein FliL